MLSVEFAQVLRGKISELESSLIAAHDHALNSFIVEHEDRERDLTQQIDSIGKSVMPKERCAPIPGDAAESSESESSEADESPDGDSRSTFGLSNVRAEPPGLTLAIPGAVESLPSRPVNSPPVLIPAAVVPAAVAEHVAVSLHASECDRVGGLLPLVPEASVPVSRAISTGIHEEMPETQLLSKDRPASQQLSLAVPPKLPMGRRISWLASLVPASGAPDQVQDPAQSQRLSAPAVPRRFSVLRTSSDTAAGQYHSERSRMLSSSRMQRLSSSARSSAALSAAGGLQGFDVLNVWKNISDGGATSGSPIKICKSKTTGFDSPDETEPEDDSVAKCLVFEPNSAKRIIWDLLGLVLIFLDGVLLPFQLFDPPESTFTSTVFWIARIFWTVDLPLSFVTGILMADGNVNMNRKLIAKAYCRSWLLPDITIVSLDWSEVLMTATQGGTGTGGTVRGLRLIRITRVARVIKLPQLVRFFDERVRSEKLMLLLSVVKITLFILGLAHVVACLWYGLGSGASGENWVQAEGLTSASLHSKYIHSFHWSITQYVGGMDEILPQNLMERLFTIIVVFCTFVVSACFVSSITSSLTRLHIIAGKRSGQFSALRRFLCDRGVSGETMVRVQRNAQHALLEKQRNVPEIEVELLSLISEPLLVEIHFEEHSPILKTHPFFALYLDMNPAGMRKLCHSGVSWKTISKGDVLFSGGEIPAHPAMHQCCGGTLTYAQHKPKGHSMKVTKGAWISEAVLWVSWTHQGLLRAATDHCRLLKVNAESFQKIASQFQNLEFHPGLYACCFAERLREQSEDSELTDITSSNMAEDIVTNAYYHEAGGGQKDARPGREPLAHTGSRHSIVSGGLSNSPSRRALDTTAPLRAGVMRRMSLASPQR